MKWFKNAWDWAMGEIWIRIIFSKRKPKFKPYPGCLHGEERAIKEALEGKDISFHKAVQTYNGLTAYAKIEGEDPPILEYRGKPLPTYDDLLMLITNLTVQACEHGGHNRLETTYIGVHDEALDMLEDLGALEKQADGSYKLDWMKLKPFENIHIFYKEKKDHG